MNILFNKTAVLCFHSVAVSTDRRYQMNQALYVSPKNLDSFIKKCKLLQVEFISISQLKKCSKGRNTFPRVCLTFDDGYKNNLHQLLPILNKHNVPACIFVTKGFVTKTVKPWWFVLEQMLVHSPLIIRQAFNLESSVTDTRAFELIRIKILTNRETYEFFLNELCKHNPQHNNRYCEQFLDQDELNYLSNHPLITLAPHSCSHRPFSLLKIDEIMAEVEESREFVSKYSEKGSDVFAFPYGSQREIGQHAPRIISNLGIKLGFTVQHGFINFKYTKNYFELPRIHADDNYEVIKLLYHLVRDMKLP